MIRTVGRTIVVALAFGLGAVACGDPPLDARDAGQEEMSPGTPSPEVQGPEAPEEEGGPPDTAGPPEGVFSPRVVKGEFRTLPAGSGLELEGPATLLRLPDGETMLNLDVEGLERRGRYEAYAHTGACGEDQGGEGYLFDPAAGGSGDNRMGGMFRADARGEAREVSFKRFVPAGPEAVSVVISEPGGDRVACADLRPTR